MKQKFFRIIADLRFSIFILLIISIVSIIGTIIEQDQPIELYKINYPITRPIFAIFTWDLILKFGFDHIYKTWWFFALIFLFGLSLIFCTFLQQLPSLKIARRCQFFRNLKQFYKLENFTIIQNFPINKILFRIQQKKYSIFQQKTLIYCYKGLIGRISPILVHLSMVIILIGLIFGSLFGFQAQEIVSEAENFRIQNILSNGKYSFLPNNLARINDFWVTYGENQTISQFYSDISVLNNQGKEVNRKTISVNRPLIHKNVYYYQTNWDLIGLRFQTKTKDGTPFRKDGLSTGSASTSLQKETFQYSVTNFSNNPKKLWLTWIPKSPNLIDGKIVLIDNLEGYCSIYNEAGKFLETIELHEFTNFDQYFSLLEILSATGLQIKTDPGIPLIYSGFGFLMLSTLLSYRTYSQVWIIQKNQKLFIGGTTNRATFDFEIEFLTFLKKSNE